MLTDCVWFTEGKILRIFWEKCQGGSVDVNTIFKNPDIYWASMFPTHFVTIQHTMAQREINIGDRSCVINATYQTGAQSGERAVV